MVKCSLCIQIIPLTKPTLLRVLLDKGANLDDFRKLNLDKLREYILRNNIDFSNYTNEPVEKVKKEKSKVCIDEKIKKALEKNIDEFKDETSLDDIVQDIVIELKKKKKE